MKIDIHSHILDRDYLNGLQELLNLTAEQTGDGKTLLRRNGTTVAWTREDMFSIDERLRDMDAKGIDVRVLSLSTPNVYHWPADEQVSVARRSNDFLAAYCRQHPDRFQGFGTLPLGDVDASLRELDRVIGDLGMEGVVIGSNIDGVPLSDLKFEPLWARIDALRLPVFEHPMFPPESPTMTDFELPLRVGLIFDTTLAAARLIYSGVFERYPNFPYIMAHTGAALLMLVERLDNGYRLFPDCRRHITREPSTFIKDLYFDTCAFGDRALMLAMDTVGPRQILFGTDDPFIDADTSHVDQLPISDEDKALIFGGNFARLRSQSKGIR